MQVYFVRHGQAVPREHWDGDDVLRPLADDARQLIAEVAVALARNNLSPAAILTSPLVRAQQTALILAGCLGIPERLNVDKRLAPGFGPEQLVKIMRDHSKLPDLMLVAQEPDLSSTITKLVGRSRLALKKGGVAQVEVHDIKAPHGRLLALLSPTLFADHYYQQDQGQASLSMPCSEATR